MRTERKLLTGALLALCGALLAFCIVLAAGWSKAAKTDAALPEVRNNGTAIQWKYSDETDWRDLVALTELRGAAGENGKDGANGENGTDGKNGINGTNGKDGINGIDGKDGADGKNGKDGIDGADGKDGIDGMSAKNIEVQRTTEYIQWRYEGDEWQNLVAIADITGPAGQKGADGANGKTPEFRVSENTLQWRYVGDEIWLNLYDLSVLKGLDGKDGINGKDGAAGKDGTNGINGQDGAAGKDGNTPFIGENGNWWIGTTDTGVKAAGVDGEKGDKGDIGEKGDKGDKGDPGEKGDKGDKGDAGQDGSSPGWFYGVGVVQSVNLQMESAPLYFQGKMSSGGLVSCDGDTVRLSRGHHYQVSVNGAVYAMSNDDKGFYSVRMTDGYDNQLCRDLTSIKVDKGKKLNETRREQHTLSFNRVYDAKGGDIVLRLALEQAEYATYLLSFRGTITITALD